MLRMRLQFTQQLQSLHERTLAWSTDMKTIEADGEADGEAQAPEAGRATNAMPVLLIWLAGATRVTFRNAICPITAAQTRKHGVSYVVGLGQVLELIRGSHGDSAFAPVASGLATRAISSCSSGVLAP